MKNLKYFIPILGCYYCVKDMNTIISNNALLYFGTSTYHALTLSLIVFFLLS